MSRYRWSIGFALALLLVSFVSYYTQIRLFHDPRDTYFYMLQDFAFVPVQVLLVTLIINELLTRRQKLDMQNKLNMVIGSFFSEMGLSLLQQLSRFDAHTDSLHAQLAIAASWDDAAFARARQTVQRHEYAIACPHGDLDALKRLLADQRRFLLVMLENPNLLEHETFTDLLWAVTHLTDELTFRESLSDLPSADYAHLAGDIRRAYTLLLTEWLAYLKHLRADYPYIYSLMVRTNPFDREASVIITTPSA